MNGPDRALAQDCRDAIQAYRDAVASGRRPSAALTDRARRAFHHLGGVADPATWSLRHYDAVRHGPFLGVSDDGSAAADIRDAALESPKVRAFAAGARPTPLEVGVAVDAERLAGVGEVAVGPHEYAQVWLACVDRVLITTNVGTRVNLRIYRREPRVIIERAGKAHMEEARNRLVAAFKPFVDTPDGVPRPLTVLIEFATPAPLTEPQKKRVLRELAAFVASGQAAGRAQAPEGHAVGLAASVGRGLQGKEMALSAIGLASSAGLRTVVLSGIRRPIADEAVSFAGLLDYFAPGIIGPLLREAQSKRVLLRAANVPDTDTIARSVWVGLANARRMGANLGKYGSFPLTRPEIAHVVEQVQEWLPQWSAAPVFFVDQGLLHEEGVDVGGDLPRGLKAWLDTVAAHGVRVVLIDTFDKAAGWHLLRSSSSDRKGLLGLRQVESIDRHAAALGVNVLWAGGLQFRDVFEMGRRGVFGIYVTSAAAITVPVAGSYVRDPALAGLKRPSKDAVLRVKVLLEAGFLAGRAPDGDGPRLEKQASELLAALDTGEPSQAAERTQALARTCRDGWRSYWNGLDLEAGERARNGKSKGKGT
ncbi:hypothetical protein [Variovorax sp. KK3]|uniref:hypothetical protein n=1 Tax=Variovorax sp. KK3 TaxID=1855728 RepID=UPI0011801DEB|nr:hypothetical protein [Variovorax sp. KK3]